MVPLICIRFFGMQRLIILHYAARSHSMKNAAVHKALKIQGLSTGVFQWPPSAK